MFTQAIEKTQFVSSELYQLIKDEALDSVVISSQILAGSRILLSTYRQVVFSDCVFYGCDFQGVRFENCIFENCGFEFTHFKKCHFKNCSFSDCNWLASTSTGSVYEDCELYPSQDELLIRGQNEILYTRNQDYTTDIYIELAAA
jgi:uncharacterized protein YjbI with pentapeptide repeats